MILKSLDKRQRQVAAEEAPAQTQSSQKSADQDNPPNRSYLATGSVHRNILITGVIGRPMVLHGNDMSTAFELWWPLQSAVSLCLPEGPSNDRPKVLRQIARIVSRD